MRRYLLTKLWHSVLTLLLSALVVFFGVRALPGDPALALAGEEADPETLAQVRADLGLDDPVFVQFGKFLANLVQGDLGTSIRTGTPVTELIAATLPVTLWLSLYAIILAVLIGVLSGVAAAVYRGRWPEWVANGFSLAGLSIPNFWLGLLAILYLSVSLGLFPASGYVPVSENPIRALYYLTLPAVILGTGLAAVVMRQTRSSMLETLSTDYVRTARAKGLLERNVIMKHAFRNALIPLVTVVALNFGGLFGGAFATETVFALDGMGLYFLRALSARDVYPLMAWLMVSSIIVVLFNLIADLIYGWLDPRIRYD